MSTENDDNFTSDKEAAMRRELSERARVYNVTFDTKSEAVQSVLADLAAFCRANESTFHTDPRAHAVLEGRREVWLRIQTHLCLDDEMLWQLYVRKAQRR